MILIVIGSAAEKTKCLLKHRRTPADRSVEAAVPSARAANMNAVSSEFGIPSCSSTGLIRPTKPMLRMPVICRISRHGSVGKYAGEHGVDSADCENDRRQLVPAGPEKAQGSNDSCANQGGGDDVIDARQT